MEQTNEKADNSHVIKSPIWVLAIRGGQVLISLIVLGLCAALLHDAEIEEAILCVVITIFTWIAVAYIVVSELFLPALYNIYAVLALDGLFVILWLATFAATAARRAKFIYSTSVSSCFDDGSLFNSKTCWKRGVILFKSGQGMFAAAAGLGALVWLLFIATFVLGLLAFLKGRKEGRFGATPAVDNANVESVAMETKPGIAPQVVQTAPGAQPQYQQPVPVQGQYVQPQPPYPQPVSPYQQTTAYPPPAAPYSPQDQQQQYQYPPQQQQPQQFQQQPPYQQQPTPVGSELDSTPNYTTPPPNAVSPPPQHYQQPPQ